MDELAKNYWSLANGITAFAVVQSLAFAYAMTKDGAERIRSQREAVTWGIALAAFAFSAAVWFCNEGHIEFLVAAATQPGSITEGLKCTLTLTMLGRVGAILGYAGFALYILRTSGSKVAAR
jgi:hypothetical protein